MVSINTNTAANIAARNIYDTKSDLEGSLSKLSSGSRIVKSSDDAGGMAVSMKMDAQELQLSALEKNLTNSLSFLETQEGALRILSQILSRISELEALKVDVTKNKGDIENYDKEIENLQSEIVKIREEKFNGVRLFSPSKAADSIEVDGFPLNNSIVDMIRPPLPTSFGADPLEIVILADVSGSMEPHIKNVKKGISSLIISLNSSNIKSWGIKVVGYPAASGNLSGSGNNFVLNSNSNPLAEINNQIDSLPRHSVFQGEPLIEALDSVTNMQWSTNKNSKKAIFAFTDEEITTTTFASQNRNDIAKKIKDLDINFNLLTEAHSDQWTDELISESGGVKGDLTDGLQNPSQYFQNYANSLNDDPFDLNDLSDYIAQNGASQSAIRHLVDSVKINRQNLNMASSRIKDVDIASETSKLSSLKVIQEAGVAMLSQANISLQSILRLLQIT
jgi:flagellin-like hook-associated protein FlgL